MTDSVTITTGARLHFGLLVQGEPERRTFGGAGVMIDEPGFTVTVSRAESSTVHASPETASRIEKLISPCRPPGADFPVSVAVQREIPAHAGLGSGTQFGLALATALSRLGEERNQPITELARRAGRSARSAIGTIGFDVGGLITQGAWTGDSTLTPATNRIEFPADWRFVLVTPRNHAGLSGEAERAAFRELPPMNDDCLRSLLEIQQELVATASAREFDDFGRRLYDFGRMVGKYFLRIQQGVFASARMESLADELRADGIFGVGQTSWGPTLFAACESPDDTFALAERVRQSGGSDCEVRIVAALNRGASFE